MISKSAVSHRSSVISLTELISHRCKQFFNSFLWKKWLRPLLCVPHFPQWKQMQRIHWSSLSFPYLLLAIFLFLDHPKIQLVFLFLLYSEKHLLLIFIFLAVWSTNSPFASIIIVLPNPSLGQILHFLKEVYWFLMTSLTWDVNYASILWDLVVLYLIWGIHSIASVGVVLNSFLASSSAVFIFLLIICIIFIKLLVFKPNFTVLG